MKKNINVTIQGFGAVGASTAVNIISSNNFINNFHVHCIDRNNKIGKEKILEARMGQFPLSSSDKSLNNFLKKGLKKKKISFGFDVREFKNADIIIVSINCDLKNYNSIQLNLFKDAIVSILNNISENTLILVESTVPPGTCQKIIHPQMKIILKKRKIDINKVYLAHSFERVTPGKNYIASIKNSHRVYAGINNNSEIKCKNFLSKIINVKKYPLTRLKNITSSETCKLMENTYRAVNIAFIDEWVKFSNQLNLNLFDIINAIKKRKTHNNIMLPGLGVGGYCLTKDPLFAKISQKQIHKKISSDFPLSTKAIELNKRMPNTSMEFIKNNYKKNLNNKKILFFGVSYKNEVGDIRHSPSLTLIKKFIIKKSKCFYFDPFVNELNIKNIEKIDKLNNLKNYDLVIFCVDHLKFKKLDIDKLKIKKSSFIFDLNNVLTVKQTFKIKNKKLTFFSLGRDTIKH
jgi:UDP-N-acetyl-D-glucosamine dehydrogenase